MERDSNFDENDTIGNNNDVVGANGVIDDTELHNLDENDNCGIQENDDEPLSNVPVTSKNQKEKQPQEYTWRKIDFDILGDIDFKPVTIHPNLDISQTHYDYFRYFKKMKCFQKWLIKQINTPHRKLLNQSTLTQTN